jgi:GNAT superfamily N-acetyltransferase
MSDIIARFWGRPAADDEIDHELADAPSDDLVPPRGLFLVAGADGAPVGCVGVRVIDNETGEITRVFVDHSARGHGLGAELLRAIEDAARGLGLRRLRLDTRADLTEARRLYARSGYAEVPAFNNSPYAEHWFGKELEPQ